jgi:hypothetical protein
VKKEKIHNEWSKIAFTQLMRMGATKEYMGIHLQVLFSQKRQPARNSVDIYLLLITNIEQETYTNNTQK